MTKKNHPRDLNNLKGLHKEMREARRAIEGKQARKDRKMRNREKHRSGSE